ncbi:hypothetical protein PHET_11794 [Paragonimus heterotremus]|uniref:Uncharacterized protein n=1 Tax=Paragonimus heterotremus TaxID=100268 RepID=A0A8J4WCS4_9TREM|nr:hypothetical protein PHET_11794 [Paragonimus heterotremus]
MSYSAQYLLCPNSQRSIILNRNGLRQIVNFTRSFLCWSDNFVEFFGLKCSLCRHCSSGVLRFVPVKPLWVRFDVTLPAESWSENEVLICAYCHCLKQPFQYLSAVVEYGELSIAVHWSNNQYPHV